MKAWDKLQERRPANDPEEIPGVPGIRDDSPTIPVYNDTMAEAPVAVEDGPGPAREEIARTYYTDQAEQEDVMPVAPVIEAEERVEEEMKPEPEQTMFLSEEETSFSGMPEALTWTADANLPIAGPEPEAQALQEGNPDIAGIYADTLVLLKYALGTGKRMPEKITLLLRQGDMNGIVQAHQELAFMIRPAIPRSVLYLEEQRKQHRHLKYLGPVPVVSYFMLTGIISFLILICCSCSPLVNETNLVNGLLKSSGLVLMVNLLFISSVSCLGAVFSILPKVNWQVRHATYLPESNMHYWSTLMLGIFGGLIMGELLSLSYDIPGTPMKFDTIVFSLMGGFASESVFHILKTLMAKIQQLVAGETREQSY